MDPPDSITRQLTRNNFLKIIACKKPRLHELGGIQVQGSIACKSTVVSIGYSRQGAILSTMWRPRYSMTNMPMTPENGVMISSQLWSTALQMGAMFAQKQVGWTYVRVRVSLLRQAHETFFEVAVTGAIKPGVLWIRWKTTNRHAKRNRGIQASQLLEPDKYSRSLCGGSTVVLRLEN